MRLLIAGWQGQLARSFVDAAALRSDISALALGRPALDLCEVRGIERALSEDRPDVVINTAGFTAVDDAEDNEQRAFALNRDGARLLARVAAERGVPIVHMSTVNVFDGTKPMPYVEDDAVAPLSVYGRSKLAGEVDVRVANTRHVILRTSWIYSTTPGTFLPNVLARARAGEILRIIADQHGSPTYAPDLAAAVLEIAAKAYAARTDASSSLWGTYHIANSGPPASWYALTEAACHAAELHEPARQIIAITSADMPTRAPRPLNAALDTGRLLKMHGLELRDWREAVAEAARSLVPSA